MVGIVDINGNPINTKQMRETQSARVAQLKQTYAGHPSRGLTPAKIARIMDSAEQGDIRSQHELFIDMEEKDAHIFSEISKRKRALLTVDWDIVPPRNPSAKERKAAAYVKELLQDVQNFEDVIQDALDAIGHGFVCLELEWQMLGKEWLPKAIAHRPQSWFQTDRLTRTQLRLRDNSADGAELQPFGWITHIHKAKSGYLSRSGLYRVLVWPYLFKNFSVRDMAEFLEIYGIPIRLGKYFPGASDDEKNALLQAVVAIGHNAAGIVPQDMAVEFVQIAANGSSTPFESMIAWAEKSQSKAILGGTLTTQADGKTSTNALGNVHNEVRHDLMMSDAKQLAGTLTRDLVYPLYALNVGGVDDMRRCPRFVFDLGEPEDIKLFSESLPPLVNAGVQIPVSWVRDKLRIPEPDGDEPVLQMQTVAANDTPPPVGANNHLPQQAATNTKIAALTATQDQDEFDIFADELAGDWERISNPMIAPILQLAASAKDYAEFQAGLAMLIKDMDTDKLAETLAQAQFAANIYGRVKDQLKEE